MMAFLFHSTALILNTINSTPPEKTNLKIHMMIVVTILECLVYRADGNPPLKKNNKKHLSF